MSVYKKTKEALLIYGNLSLEQFIKINKEKFEEEKAKESCFCIFHNDFLGASEEGLKLSLDDLKKFYEYCVGPHITCKDLKDAVSMLAGDDTVREKFLASFN